MTILRTISLTQPWASLIALGAKQIETRSWSTNYRGPIAIHAAKGLPPGLRLGEYFPLGNWTVSRDKSGLLLRGPIDWPYRLPLGSVVAVATLMDVRSTNSVECRPSDRERPFGDYSPDRYAWYLSSVSPLRDPIPAKGALGFWAWELPDDLNAQLRYPLRAAS